MATIDDFGGSGDPLSLPKLGGPDGWAAAVRDMLRLLEGGLPGLAFEVVGLATGEEPTVDQETVGDLTTVTIGIPDGATGPGAQNPNFTFTTVPIAAGGSPTIAVTGTYPDLNIELGLVTGAAGATAAALTTKGDVLGHDGSNGVRIPAGPDGLTLQPDATATAGVAWKSFGNLAPMNVATGCDTLGTTAGWAARSGVTVTADNTVPAAVAQGTYALKATSASSVAQWVGFGTTSTTTFTNGTIPVLPGQTYTAFLDAYSETHTSSMLLSIYWWTAAGNVAASTASSSSVTMSLAASRKTWAVVATAPADAAFASVVFRRPTSSATLTFYVDAVTFHRGIGGRWAVPGQQTPDLGEVYTTATPEALVVAPVGARAVDQATGTVYTKTAGTDATGWTALVSGSVTPAKTSTAVANGLSATLADCTGTPSASGGWYPQATLTVAVATGAGIDAGDCYSITVNTTTGSATITSHSSTTVAVPVTPGNVVSTFVWVKPSRDMEVRINADFDAGDTFYSRYQVARADTWTQIGGYSLVPAGASKVRAEVEFGNITEADVYYMDRGAIYNGLCPDWVGGGEYALPMSPNLLTPIFRTVHLAAVIRNYEAPDYWAPITVSNHTPLNIWKCVTDSTKIRVYYSQRALAAGSIVVTPDEGMASSVLAGSSVGLQFVDIYLKSRSDGSAIDPTTVGTGGDNLWILGTMHG